MMYKSITMLAAALALLGAGAAFAAPGPGGAGWHKRDHAPFAMLKAQLKLTPAQEPAWNQVMAAMQSLHPKRGEKRAMKKPAAAMTAPELFDKLAAFAEQRARGAQALAQAVKTLYGELTPVQRAVLDTHLADMRLARRHHRHGMHGWEHHGRPMAAPAPGSGSPR